MVDNYLFCESLIIEKLKNDVTGLVDISGAADLASLGNENPPCPCVYVMYAGDITATTPAATGGISRNAQMVTQIWSVVLCVYLPDSRGIGTGVSDIAGGFISQINKSLRGFKPKSICTPIQRHSTPIFADYLEDGCCYYTIGFRIQFPDI